MQKSLFLLLFSIVAAPVFLCGTQRDGLADVGMDELRVLLKKIILINQNRHSESALFGNFACPQLMK